MRITSLQIMMIKRLQIQVIEPFFLGITFTDKGNELGYVKGTITGTVYDRSTETSEYDGDEYSLDFDLAVKLFEGNPPPEGEE
jgi:hypothetical protein